MDLINQDLLRKDETLSESEGGWVEGRGVDSLVDLALAMLALWAAVEANSVNGNVRHLLGRDLHLQIETRKRKK